MLEHTFIHIQGIGLKTERYLWKTGISTWWDFLLHEGTVFSPARDEMIRSELNASVEHLNDITFFGERLSSAHMWRVFETFRDRAVYLDIETSGGPSGMDEITVIGIYDGCSVRSFVNGINLDDFEIAIAPYALVITFNGSGFDLPYIRRRFPNISLPPAHIDLRFLLNRLGYRGGLKRIEKAFGLSREREIEGLNGYDAVRLWQAHQWGEPKALGLLVKYNTADIVHLEPLMEAGYRAMKEGLLASGNDIF